MNQRAERRRKSRRASQALFYDAIVDRRDERDRRDEPVIVAALPPGAIRPLPGEQVQVERRRFPESGTE
jgi:hypothetical protein